MPRFRYLAFTAHGQREDGILELASETQAWEKLSSLHLTVVELVEDAGQGQLRPLTWQRGIPFTAQAELAEQLAVLFAARLPVPQIVEVIEKGATLPAIKRQFRRVAQLMADGMEFPDALQETGKGLSPLFLGLARLGQTTSDPTILLKTLALTLRRQEKIAGQLRAALVYPTILLIGGLGILAIMALYLAPQLQSVFTSVGKPLPYSLSAFVAFGDLLRAWAPMILVGIAALLVMMPLLLARLQTRLRTLTQSLPVVGPIVREAALARLTRSVELLLAAGRPLSLALRETASAFASDPLSRPFDAAAARIEAGSRGSPAFSEDSRMPVFFRSLFAIGEETNTLPTVMSAVATSLEEQVERRTQRAALLITPVLTLIVGTAIALLVYSVMSALLSINELAL